MAGHRSGSAICWLLALAPTCRHSSFQCAGTGKAWDAPAPASRKLSIWSPIPKLHLVPHVTWHEVQLLGLGIRSHGAFKNELAQRARVTSAGNLSWHSKPLMEKRVHLAAFEIHSLKLLLQVRGKMAVKESLTKYPGFANQPFVFYLCHCYSQIVNIWSSAKLH